MRILFVTNEALGERRSGPAIRCIELARAVARKYPVGIAALQPGELQVEGIEILADALRRKRDLKSLTRASDVVVTQGMALARYPAMRKLARHLVIDLYDPYLFEYLQHAHPKHPQWGYLRQWHRLNQQMLAGDFFLCANERQWDYWLGRLCALGRLTPQQHEQDSSFRGLLDVVPFGLPGEPPQHRKNVLRGVVAGIGEKDFVLLWAGGLWQWLDPLTPIRAMKEVAAERAEVKLVFLGAKDPNPNNRAMNMAEQAKQLAAECGALNKTVFFHEEWAPYDERQNFLLEADAGISAHPATVETRFAFRTRVLDYIWAGLPMILSCGDDLGDWAAREGVGLAIALGDVQGWKRSILKLAGDGALRQAMRSRLQTLAPDFYWEKAAEPLLRYCENPRRAARPSGIRKKIVPVLSAGFELARKLRG